jgi:hypothetical protein
MGRLIVSAQMTMDSVMDQLDGWFDPERESEQHGVEQLRAADALVLGRKTYEGLAAFWPTQEGAYADRKLSSQLTALPGRGWTPRGYRASSARIASTTSGTAASTADVRPGP